MPDLPSATQRLIATSGGIATGTDLVCVFSPVATHDDMTPRLFSSVNDLLTYHGYAQGVDYTAMHVEATRKPVLFVGLPIDTVGTVGRFDASGNTGTSVVTCAAGSDGALEETDGILKVTTGGTIGTDQIVLSLSLDGGRIYKPVRLGTASSYTIPYVGLTLSFAGGTLVADDTALTWHSTAPKPASADIATARTNLAAQQKQCRSWLMAWDVSVLGDATPIKTAIDAFKTTNTRFGLAKCALRDRLPEAEMSRTTVRMTGSPNITFAEVGATGDTITRSSGSFVTDGFVANDRITITGAVDTGGANNLIDVRVATVAPTILTLDTGDLVNEGPIAGVAITGSPAITFAEVGATGDTITRSRGSWLDDGFRAGDIITVADTASNDFTGGVIDTVTALVITLTSQDLVAESIRSDLITIEAGEADVACIATLDAAFATITSDEKVDLGYGRGAMLSPILGYKMRRNINWADSILAYVRDIRTTTWWKKLGPIRSRIPAGFDLNDADGNPYEHDERTTAGALAARFTCARTWGNGPVGAFVARSLTRAADGSVLGHTHNVVVANLYQTIVQAVTENWAGATMVLEPADDAGVRVATSASLAELNTEVNSELARYLLSNIGGEGQRASVATWTAATDDDLGVADATLHGGGNLEVNGTLVHIDTTTTVK